MFMEDKQEKQMHALLTVRGVAQYLAVTERTVYRLVKDHGLPAYKVGGLWRFKVELIDAWMSQERALRY